jgi:anhydro-N-acetylmuramic acid kinase
MLVDALVSHFTRGGQHFDKDARLALKGSAIEPLLSELSRDPYFHRQPPKSTGREYFGYAYVEKLLRLGRKHGAKPNDLIRAATTLTVASIWIALQRFVLPKTKVHQLIVSGGGARNPLIHSLLVQFLRNAKIEVVLSGRLGIPENAKEAFAFAILAYETFHRRPANLPSATGARKPAILGKVSYAAPR